MKKTMVLIFLLALSTTMAWGSAGTSKQIDTITNSTGGSALSVPNVGTTFSTDTNTLTLQNKSISGSSNTFSNIPTTAIAGSALSGTNTGDVTLGTANGLSLSGQVLSLQAADASHTGALTSTDWSTFNGKLSSALTTNHLFVGVGGVATDVAMSGDASLASTGAITLSTVNSNVGSFTNANITVNAKGLITAASNGTATAPSLNGSQASPQSVTAAGGISLSSIGYANVAFVVSNSGAVTVTATPSITACTAAGQQLIVLGESGTNVITLQDEASLAGTKLRLNGNWTSALNSTLSLLCDGNGFWIEIARQQ